jgi:hypothetical protein
MTNVANKTDVTSYYAPMFKAWSKAHGSKPTAEMLISVHGLGARPGKQALASAMALRPEGVTGSQIILATGAPQLNKMRGFITDGVLKRLPAPPSAEGHKVYRLELTAKGKQRIASTAAREAKLNEAGKATDAVEKPAKVKAKPAKKAASKPAAKPVDTKGAAVMANALHAAASVIEANSTPTT